MHGYVRRSDDSMDDDAVMSEQDFGFVVGLVEQLRARLDCVDNEIAEARKDIETILEIMEVE